MSPLPRLLAAGAFALLLAATPVRAQERNVPCTAGFAGSYPCLNVDLLAHIALPELLTHTAAEVWGWTDPQTSREYALLGLGNGTAFVDVTLPTAPVYLGKLPTATTGPGFQWRSVRTYGNYMFVGSEIAGHGVQVFDLTRLRGLTAPPASSWTADARYTGAGKSHTLGLNEATGFIYLAGANEAGFQCSGGGLHIVDVRNPLTPVFAGCYDGDGYTHENQCIVYHGPDTTYNDREICIAYNEDTVTAVDVTNKSAPTLISRGMYPSVGYTHQGWFTEDRRYLFVDDELDELNGLATTARTIVMDASDLDNLGYVGSFLSGVPSSDHNQYVRGNYLYQSNYQAGLRILRIDNPAAASVTEVGRFDTYLEGNQVSASSGQWMNYPYFASGIVVASDINNGLFVLRPTAGTVAGESGPLPASGFRLDSPVPNPTTGTTRLSLTVGEAQAVRAEAFDALGRRVAVVLGGTVPAGTTDLVFDGSALPAGVYVVRVVGETFTTAARVSVAR
ncbi:MAG TPA: choice-of-anchor B family protein [Rubricoccaceae bacterium]|jgi:choice-of-anchor B domain-containing protein